MIWTAIPGHKRLTSRGQPETQRWAMTVDSKGYFGTGYDRVNRLNDFWGNMTLLQYLDTESRLPRNGALRCGSFRCQRKGLYRLW